VEKYNHNSAWIFSKLLKSLELTLEEFGWLPHRLENIWTYKGVTFIDDGISTTPESTIEAIKTYGKSVNCLFLWWADYWFTNESYKLLKDSIIENNINKIVFFPTTWLDVFWIKTKDNINWAEFEFSYNGLLITAICTDNMETAVKFAYKHIDSWICLMSCAAPSYSVWSWYEEKWKLFKEAILKNKDS
jgi:UDP-N-acetylmuramoylalanine-D-glutamate ligase